MQTVVETAVFVRRAEKLLSEQELAGFTAFLASNPIAGDRLSARAASARFGMDAFYAYALVIDGKEDDIVAVSTGRYPFL